MAARAGGKGPRLGVLAALALLGMPTPAPAQWTSTPEVEGLTGAEVRAVEVASDGVVWLGVRGRGLARLDGGAVQWVGVDDGLMGDGIAAIHEDRSGRLWAGGGGGFSVLEVDGWVSRHTFGGITPRIVFDVHEDVMGGVWLGTNQGAVRQTSGGWELVESAETLPHSVVHAVVVQRSGATWFACRRGLGRRENGSMTVFFPEVNFRDAALAPDGTLWFGTPEGIYAWDGAAWSRHREGQAAYPLLVTQDGTVWAGSSDDAILRYSDGAWVTVELPAYLRGAEVFDLASVPDGSIWVATSKGAARYDPRGTSGG